MDDSNIDCIHPGGDTRVRDAVPCTLLVIGNLVIFLSILVFGMSGTSFAGIFYAVLCDAGSVTILLKHRGKKQ